MNKKNGDVRAPIIKKHKDGSISVSLNLQKHGIKLELKAKADGWRKLDRVWLEEDKDATKDIYWEMIMPAIEWLDSKKPRGKYKDAKPFIERLLRIGLEVQLHGF